MIEKKAIHKMNKKDSYFTILDGKRCLPLIIPKHTVFLSKHSSSASSKRVNVCATAISSAAHALDHHLENSSAEFPHLDHASCRAHTLPLMSLHHILNDRSP